MCRTRAERKGTEICTKRHPPLPRPIWNYIWSLAGHILLYRSQRVHRMQLVLFRWVRAVKGLTNSSKLHKRGLLQVAQTQEREIAFISLLQPRRTSHLTGDLHVCPCAIVRSHNPRIAGRRASCERVRRGRTPYTVPNIEFPCSGVPF